MKPRFPNGKILRHAEGRLPRMALDWPWFYLNLVPPKRQNTVALVCHRCNRIARLSKCYTYTPDIPSPRETLTMVTAVVIAKLCRAVSRKRIATVFAAPCDKCQSVCWFIAKEEVAE